MANRRNNMSGFRCFSYLTLAFLVFLLVQSRSAFGQVDEGSITGTVQDTSGAVVANAQVILLNTDQGITLETKSSGSGSYTFSPVRIGHYTLTATATGFQKTTQQNLTVAISQNLQVNVQLKPGTATETVVVTEAPPQLQTEDASVGQVVTEQTINNLPLNGRNFTFLAQLGAGMQTPQADTRGNAASGAFSANGLRPAQNNYLLDGIDNNSNAVDFLNGTNFIVLPPVDAISEFKVQTGEFSAELGRSAGAVLNATIKSGTNSFHGAVWEFFRNDKLDAADWFEANSGTPKGELRFNTFGGTAGGPIIKNKVFFFGDYEGKRRVQGTSDLVAVPTVAERSSGYTNLSDLISGTARADALGRQIIPGTVLDPATTRAVTAGVVDPVSGLTATSTGYARDPFGCSASNTTPSVASCPTLNQLPATRLNLNAIKLMNLYPAPNTGGTATASNYQTSPNVYEHGNSFDVRVDVNPSEKEQIFFRFSYVDDPQFIPGPFGGIADGGGFQQGLQTAHSNQSVGVWTHVFSPTTVNVGRVGFNHLHTTRFGPDGGTSGIPAQFNIQGIPQANENGGLGSYDIGGLQTLGSNAFLPSDEISQTLQITDDFTKIYGKHSFKMGMEYQHVKFSTLQPAFSRGNFDYNGAFTDVPNNNVSNETGKAQFLLDPIASTVAGGTNYVGGSDSINASNINKTYDEKNYLALYLQDDWKVSPKLTLNLGLRWDYFGPIGESNGGQANFVPSGLPSGKPLYLIPATGKDDRTLSSTATTPTLIDSNGNPVGFVDLLAKDGITLVQTNEYGKGLVQTQKYNFAPRVGFAYQVNPKLVVRGGFGMFYNSFENQGYGPNIGENYPFVFNFGYTQSNLGSPGAAPLSAGTPYTNATCSGDVNSHGDPVNAVSLESGLSCINFNPSVVNASGLGLQGLQFNYQTPLTLSANGTLQYSLSHNISAQVSYVVTDGRHLQTGIGTNDVSQLLPKNLPSGQSTANYVPFPDFSQGSSYHTTVGSSIYNGLQAKLEQQYANGLSFLLAYTYSKTLSDAGDLLNGGSSGGYRAPYVPGYGVKFDRGLADFDLRQVLHFSGNYALPFGKDKRFMNHSNKIVDAVAGGWGINWIATLQGGQPITLGCPTGATTGTGCNDLNVPGQSQKLGIKVITLPGGTHAPVWFGNPAAFSQPCPLGVTPVPTNCTPAGNGVNILGGYNTTTTGPGYHKLDFSASKGFQLTERFSLQFRSEFFNILNHPNFNAPGFGGNGVVSISGSTDFTNGNFGQIGSTRDGAYSSREIQFALKLYY